MLLTVLAAVLWWMPPREDDSAPETPGREARSRPPPQPVDTAAPTPSRPVAPQATLAGEPDAGSALPAPEQTPAPEAAREHPVNLEKLREQMPDNLYWELGAPTKDPEILRRREEQTRHWNALLGKVQSNTATEEEIHQYYDHRRAVSEDFIAFASRVLQEHGAQLSEQERGLYELSIQMHRTRLEEIPRQVQDALARKETQDRRREEWRRGKQGP
ncbi:hypothetical protein F0U62_19885 [Cystobacter fuscus]|uniref:hypothetical protein n=1 Tax=Cystobacter fuscus TaxID=43 RepID=UPI002B2ED292|nr:hypothetical protein F0U62_19885 [Cystobacter fuscus]